MVMYTNNTYVDDEVGADTSAQVDSTKSTPSKGDTLLKEKTYLSRDTHISRVKTYKTSAGPLFLSTNCTPAFVEELKVDDGLRAFLNANIACSSPLLSNQQIDLPWPIPPKAR